MPLPVQDLENAVRIKLVPVVEKHSRALIGKLENLVEQLHGSPYLEKVEQTAQGWAKDTWKKFTRADADKAIDYIRSESQSIHDGLSALTKGDSQVHLSSVPTPAHAVYDDNGAIAAARRRLADTVEATLEQSGIPSTLLNHLKRPGHPVSRELAHEIANDLVHDAHHIISRETGKLEAAVVRAASSPPR